MRACFEGELHGYIKVRLPEEAQKEKTKQGNGRDTKAEVSQGIRNESH